MTNFNHQKHLYARSKSSNRGVRGFHREQGYFGAVRKGFHPVNKRRPIVSVPKLAKSNGSDLPSTPSNAVSVASTSSAIASNISTVQNQSEIQVSSVEGASDGSETQNVLSITADVKSSSTDRVDCVDVLEAASTSNEMDNDNSDMVPESLTSDVIDAQKIRSDIDPTTTFGLTVDDRYKIRHFSMRGNESSHTLNEDAVRIGKRQDDKNFGIVCDGISTPFGSHSFVNAFINKLQFQLKNSDFCTESGLQHLIKDCISEAVSLLKLVQVDFDENTAGCTLALAVEVSEGKWKVLTVGDPSVVLLNDETEQLLNVYEHLQINGNLKYKVSPNFENLDFMFHDVVIPDGGALYLSTDGNRFGFEYQDGLSVANCEEYLMKNPLEQKSFARRFFQNPFVTMQGNYTSPKFAAFATKNGKDESALRSACCSAQEDNFSVVVFEKLADSSLDSENSSNLMPFETKKIELTDSEQVGLSKYSRKYGISVTAKLSPKSYDLIFDYGSKEVNDFVEKGLITLPTVVIDVQKKLRELIANINKLNVFAKEEAIKQFNLFIHSQSACDSFNDNLGCHNRFMFNINSKYHCEQIIKDFGFDVNDLPQFYKSSKTGEVVLFKAKDKKKKYPPSFANVLYVVIERYKFFNSFGVKSTRELLTYDYAFKALQSDNLQSLSQFLIDEDCHNDFVACLKDCKNLESLSKISDLDKFENALSILGIEFHEIVNLKSIPQFVFTYHHTCNSDVLYKILNIEGFEVNDNRFLKSLASIPALDLSKITNDTLKTKLEGCVEFPKFDNDFSSARKSDSYAPSKFGLVPRVNWDTKQIEMVYPDSGTVVTMFKDGEFVNKFNEFLSGFDAEFKAQGYQELVNQFVNKNADKFKIKKPTGFWHKADRFANSLIYSVVPSAMHRMSQLQKTVLPVSVSVALGYALMNYLGVDDGGANSLVFGDNSTGGIDIGSTDSFIVGVETGSMEVSDGIPVDSEINSMGESDMSEGGTKVLKSDSDVKTPDVPTSKRSVVLKGADVPTMDSTNSRTPIDVTSDSNIQIRTVLSSTPTHQETDTEFNFAANAEPSGVPNVDLEGVQQLHQDRVLYEPWTVDSLTAQPQALVEMNQNWDFTQAGSLSDVYTIDSQGVDAYNQDMIALPDVNFVEQEVEVDTLGDRLLARDENGEVVKAKQGLLRRMKSVGAEDGSSLTLKGESKIFKVYDKGVMKAIRYFQASDGNYYAGCYLKAV